MKKIVILALHLSVGGIERVITNVSNLLCENNDVTIISTYKINENPSFEIDDRINIEYLLEDLKPNRKELKDDIKNLNIIFKKKIKDKSNKKNRCRYSNFNKSYA